MTTKEEFKKMCVERGLKDRDAVADEMGRSKEWVKSLELGKRPVPEYAVKHLLRLRKKRSSSSRSSDKRRS